MPFFLLFWILLLEHFLGWWHMRGLCWPQSLLALIWSCLQLYLPISRECLQPFKIWNKVQCWWLYNWHKPRLVFPQSFRLAGDGSVLWMEFMYNAQVTRGIILFSEMCPLAWHYPMSSSFLGQHRSSDDRRFESGVNVATLPRHIFLGSAPSPQANNSNKLHLNNRWSSSELQPHIFW